jgi:hypothetical protein
MDESTPGYLEAGDVDAVARMLNALLTEHWIMRDRLAILEQLLVDSGVVHGGAIDRYTPQGEFAENLEALRQTTFSKVLGAPFAQEDRTVENLRNRNP